MAAFKIGFLGVGGVGGYFGGRIAERFAGSEEVETVFIARGANADAIRDQGLRIVASEGETLLHPNLVTDDPDAIGEVDLLIVATKAYDLEDSIRKYAPLIGPRTSILPLLNGVDHADTIAGVFPDADDWNGCVFIVARLESPGVVRVENDIRLFHFGSRSGSREKLEKFFRILTDSGIAATLSDDIDRTVWEKFIFISPMATMTSALDVTIGEMRDAHRDELKAMIGEVAAVARAKGINIPDDVEAVTLEKIGKAPPASTSSMHSDFKKGGRTELETLTGFVVREARKLGVAAPKYEKYYGTMRSGRQNTVDGKQ